MVATCILQALIELDTSGGVQSVVGGKDMEIEDVKDLDGVKVLFQAYFVFDILHIDKLIKKKDNGKSIRFEVISKHYKLNTHPIAVSSYTQTIKKTKIVTSKIPYFTTREEAIEYLIEGNKDELEYYKEKIKTIPKVISFLEELKAKQSNLMEYAKC